MRGAIVNVLSPLRFRSRDEYRTLVRLICKCPLLVPDFYDGCEPIRKPFAKDDPESVADAVWGWKNGPSEFFWKRKNPKTSGSFFPDEFPKPKVHSWLCLDAGDAVRQGDLVPVVKELSASLEADFAFLEIEPPPHPNGSAFGVTTFDLEKRLPNFYWATVFGKPYVSLFGHDQLRDVPAFVNTELAPDLFYIQLTERLTDITEHPDVVEKARQLAKEHLGLEAFVIPPGATKATRLPTFSFAAPEPSAQKGLV
jgi:hypothetical protein